jgi:hypothetical protein
MAPALAVIGAVASVGGTVMAVNQQKKAAALTQRQQELATRRSQRQAIREAQIRRAQTLASAQALGGAGGSGAAGGTASLTSQVGGALGFSGQMSGLSKEIGVAQTKASTGMAIAGFGSSLFQAGGGFSTLFPNMGGGAQGPDAGKLLSGIA